MIACSEALYNVRLLRGSLQGWLAPRLTTGIARSKALSWPASRLVHFKALYEACSKDLYEARSLGGLLGGLLRGSPQTCSLKALYVARTEFLQGSTSRIETCAEEL